MIGNGTDLDNAPKDAAAGGWQKVNGLASQRSGGGVPDHDNIAFVNTDKTNHAQVVAITANRVITDGFADPSDRLSGYIRHETTHLFYYRGHIDKTIIQQGIPWKENDIYTQEMIETLQRRFGKYTE